MTTVFLCLFVFHIYIIFFLDLRQEQKKKIYEYQPGCYFNPTVLILAENNLLTIDYSMIRTSGWGFIPSQIHII